MTIWDEKKTFFRRGSSTHIYLTSNGNSSCRVNTGKHRLSYDATYSNSSLSPILRIKQYPLTKTILKAFFLKLFSLLNHHLLTLKTKQIFKQLYMQNIYYERFKYIHTIYNGVGAIFNSIFFENYLSNHRSSHRTFYISITIWRSRGVPEPCRLIILLIPNKNGFQKPDKDIIPQTKSSSPVPYHSELIYGNSRQLWSRAEVAGVEREEGNLFLLRPTATSLSLPLSVCVCVWRRHYFTMRRPTTKNKA